MNQESLFLLLAVIAFLITFASGYVLHSKGKPYRTLLLAIHKLIPLGVGAIVVIMAVNESKAGGLTTAEAVTFGITLFLLAATIVTGGLVSVKREMPAVIKLIHKILPYPVLVACILFFYFSFFA